MREGVPSGGITFVLSYGVRVYLMMHLDTFVSISFYHGHFISCPNLSRTWLIMTMIIRTNYHSTRGIFL